MPDDANELDQRRDQRHKDEADGFFDAWRGFPPDPDLLGNDHDDYMKGYADADA